MTPAREPGRCVCGHEKSAHYFGDEPHTACQAQSVTGREPCRCREYLPVRPPMPEAEPPRDEVVDACCCGHTRAGHDAKGECRSPAIGRVTRCACREWLPIKAASPTGERAPKCPMCKGRGRVSLGTGINAVEGEQPCEACDGQGYGDDGHPENPRQRECVKCGSRPTGEGAEREVPHA